MPQSSADDLIPWPGFRNELERATETRLTGSLKKGIIGGVGKSPLLGIPIQGPPFRDYTDCIIPEKGWEKEAARPGHERIFPWFWQTRKLVLYRLELSILKVLYSLYTPC